MFLIFRMLLTRHFFDVGVDIEHEKFHRDGRSKARRMRVFWDIGSDTSVAKALHALFDYIEATNPNGAGGDVEARHRSIADKLVGKKTPQNKPVTESEFLAEEFGRINLDALGLDSALHETIKQRMTEIRNCIESQAPLASIFLAGSTLEGLLLNQATGRPADYNKANSSPKGQDGKVKQFHEWTLSDLINVACEVGDIGLDVKKFSHALRGFRNYIHPYEQAQSQFAPDTDSARISWQVLRAAIADLGGKR